MRMKRSIGTVAPNTCDRVARAVAGSTAGAAWPLVPKRSTAIACSVISRPSEASSFASGDCPAQPAQDEDVEQRAGQAQTRSATTTAGTSPTGPPSADRARRERDRRQQQLPARLQVIEDVGAEHRDPRRGELISPQPRYDEHDPEPEPGDQCAEPEPEE